MVSTTKTLAQIILQEVIGHIKQHFMTTNDLIAKCIQDFVKCCIKRLVHLNFQPYNMVFGRLQHNPINQMGWDWPAQFWDNWKRPYLPSCAPKNVRLIFITYHLSFKYRGIYYTDSKCCNKSWMHHDLWPDMLFGRLASMPTLWLHIKMWCYTKKISQKGNLTKTYFYFDYQGWGKSKAYDKKANNNKTSK